MADTQSINILIVEDESLVAWEIRETLASFGYQNVDEATSGSAMLDRLATQQYDLLLLDIHLGEQTDSITLYQSLDEPIPVIYLTAYKDDATIQRAIATDPIGYLIKPLNDDELKALLLLAEQKCLSRPLAPAAARMFPLGQGYRFDTQQQKLFYRDRFVHLGKNELHLLQLLIAARGMFVSYESIEYEIWGSQVVSSSAVRTLIYRLRSKLTHPLLENQAGYGVRLVPPQEKQG